MEPETKFNMVLIAFTAIAVALGILASCSGCAHAPVELDREWMVAKV